MYGQEADATIIFHGFVFELIRRDVVRGKICVMAVVTVAGLVQQGQSKGVLTRRQRQRILLRLNFAEVKCVFNITRLC